MIKVFLTLSLLMFALGFFGMLWASERGARTRGVNEEFFYGLFTVFFFLSCIVSPILLLSTAIIWAWG